jgi:two-component system sensor histidine kinase KdpD
MLQATQWAQLRRAIAAPETRRTVASVAVGAAAIAITTVAVAVLEDYTELPSASSVYLVGVVVVAIVAGTLGAVVAAIASVLVYDFLFTDPKHTLAVADAGEWLNLLVLLFVAITVGQLAALQRRRAQAAVAREREARTLFQVSRALATRASTAAVLPEIAETLATEGGFDRVWFALGPDDARERVAADTAGDTAGGAAPARAARYAVLRRMPSDVPAEWVQVHESPIRGGPRLDEASYRVRIEGGGATHGSIWAQRPRHAGEPDRTETRLLAVAADQVGQALAQDRLAAEARQAEIARQSDALKSALLESVSHDLRTPLASIRAAAGTLMDPDVKLTWDDARASAAAIDRQAQRLNRVVANLLDLGRIEGGALRASPELLDLRDVVSRAVAAVPMRPGDPEIEIDVAEAETVEADPVLLEEALLNLLDNAVRHTPPGTQVRVSGADLPAESAIRVTVEDGGPGVPGDMLPRLFERFQNDGGAPTGGRRRPSAGLGIGLAVVRGLVEAMGGRVSGRRGALGGLAIDLELPQGRVPAGLGLEAST